MQVNGPGSVSGSRPVSQTSPAQAATEPKAAEPTSSPRDEVEISEASRMFDQLNQSPEVRAERLAQIKAEIEDSSSEYDKEKLQERLAKLSGGVAQINVGAATEVEMKEKKARVEDALHATQAALEEGILPGGGVALIRALKALEKADVKGDEKVGIGIVRWALEAPLKQIAENAGFDGAIVTEKVSSSKESWGFDASTGKYVDMFKAGIIDPTKVTRCAVENAASIASLLLTTAALVSEIPEEKGNGKGGPPGGMPGMY